jgi:3-isopropylmalate dehydrogenase
VKKSTGKLAVLPGDGIGPEVMIQAIKVLDAVKNKYSFDLIYEYADVGGAAIDNQGHALPASTLSLCESGDAILFGSVGGPLGAFITGDAAGKSLSASFKKTL